MKKFKVYLSGGKAIESDKALVMGILNATPDSFSDGGELADKNTIQNRVKQIIKDGADILDVGGESTRPGHTKINNEEEIARILPVIRAIREISKDIPISIDTRKSEVAIAALEAGASFVNDISALGDENMAEVIKRFNCSIILMRNEATGKDVIKGCVGQFKEIISRANSLGLSKDRLLLDPGLGFGDLKSGDYKSLPGSEPAANIMLILHIDEYSLGLPVVIGGSRKRFVSAISGEKDAKDRLAGSIAIAVMAKQAGAAIVRVHDVAETVRTFKNL